ncbi:MAG: ROK family protein [Candidatus Margulisbacteria bacterium]|nr:ROK family protein [Candidatus Margulisiibacteriota bacterium]
MFSVDRTIRQASFHNNRGSLTLVKEIPLPTRSTTFGTAPRLLPSMLVDTIAHNVPKMHFDALAVAIAGPVAPGGVVTKAPNIWGPEVEDFPLAFRLASETGLQTTVINDVTAIAWREKMYGTAKQYDEFQVITVSEGLGSKLFTGGQVVIGEDGQAGEIGHLTIKPGSTVHCGCGGYGHLESFTAAPAAERIARELSVGPETSTAYNQSLLAKLTGKGIENLTRAKIAAAAQAGDPFTLAFLSTLCGPLSITIGEVFAKHPVDKFILTGDFTFLIGKPYLDTLNNLVSQEIIHTEPMVSFGTNDGNSGLIGAGAAALAKLG